MRNAALHRQLETLTVDASGCLGAELAGGAEIPFEVTEERAGGRAVGLYVYRPLTGDFIRGRMGELAALASHADALRALAGCEALDSYLVERGAVKLPDDRRALSEAVLEAFLAAVFAERSEFGFEPAHFEAAYSASWSTPCTRVIAPPP